MSAEKEVAATAESDGDVVCESGNGSSGPSLNCETSEPKQEKKESNVRLVLLFAAMAIAVFCGGLDANLVAPAIPSITDALGSSDDAGWYGTAYYLALSCCQMGWAQVYKAFPAKPVFFGAFLVFELGCLLGALAPNSAAVIIGRAISGAGISGTFVGALIIVSYIIPLRWRPMMSAFFSVLIGSTQTAGPVLGGALTSRLSWRWCFWINLPLGGASVILALLGSKIKDPASRRGGKTMKQVVRDFDFLSLAIWIPAVVCLTLILQFGGLRYAWTSGSLIALYVVTVALFALFVVIQVRHGDSALAPVRIVKQRSLACSALYVLLMQAAKSQLAYFLPIFFQASQGKSALQSGVDTIPSFLSYVVFQISASMSMSWLGYYTPFMLTGSAVGIAGTALLSTLTVSTSSPKWIGFQILASAGFGMGFNGPNVAAQTVFQDPRDTPTALTIITTCQDLGGSLGTSIGEAILGDQVRRQLRRVLPGLTTKQISDEGITGLQNLVAPDQRYHVAEAYAYAVRAVFYGSTALVAVTLVLACFVEWKSIKGKGKKGEKKDS
ncbi:Putative HC-toxin efflux carrier TOXA [Cytospora mali]|uniref:HC-toxin efflux carrier TOXA n=1 Tax=Cytospora mali TaxID=578113 RepID=A0A194VDS5_CYTMA|nr:Putative HC-toxin efflux carrier TOXA [Valsa mali var. pyri (nom. inval.)]